MDAKSERKEGVLVFFINGRLDAFGAQQLDEWIKGALHDDDKELVLDLSGSTYLSSGGLRTFNVLKKEMKRRNGRFALAGVGEYPKKVLDMAGFTTILEIFPTTDAAVEDIKKKRKNPTLFNEIFYKKIEEEGVTLTIEPGWMTTPPPSGSPGISTKSCMHQAHRSRYQDPEILRDHLLARPWRTWGRQERGDAASWRDDHLVRLHGLVADRREQHPGFPDTA